MFTSSDPRRSAVSASRTTLDSPLRLGRAVSPFRPASASVVLGQGAFIRARAARGLKVTVATLPIVRAR
jgi:hypothetical protein